MEACGVSTRRGHTNRVTLYRSTRSGGGVARLAQALPLAASLPLNSVGGGRPARSSSTAQALPLKLYRSSSTAQLLLPLNSSTAQLLLPLNSSTAQLLLPLNSSTAQLLLPLNSSTAQLLLPLNSSTAQLLLPLNSFLIYRSTLATAQLLFLECDENVHTCGGARQTDRQTTYYSPSELGTSLGE